MDAAVELPDNAAAPDPARLLGHIDAVENRTVYGWAWHPDRPKHRFEIELRCDGTALTVALADRPRSDLREGGIGDGEHAFEASLPEGFDDSRRSSLHAHVRWPGGGTVPLPSGVSVQSADFPKAVARRLQDLLGMHRVLARALRELAAEDQAKRDIVTELGRKLDAVEVKLGQIDALETSFTAFLGRFDRQLQTLERQRPPPAPSFQLGRLVAVLAMGLLAGAAAMRLIDALTILPGP